MSRTESLYGLHAVRLRLQRQPETVLTLFVDRERKDTRIQTLLGLAQKEGISFEETSRAKLTEKADSDKHQGVVALVKPLVQPASIDHLLDELTEPPCLLVLDSVQDPHNLGACLRSAAAAGAHAVILPKDRSVSLTASARKVACGAAEIIPVFTVTNLVRTLKQLQQRGIWLLGAAVGENKNFYEADFKGPVAIVLGAEDQGLRRLTREVCDELFVIPMCNGINSVNVSVATGIFLFEVLRQRISVD